MLDDTLILGALVLLLSACSTTGGREDGGVDSGSGGNGGDGGSGVCPAGETVVRVCGCVIACVGMYVLLGVLAG